MNAPIPQHQFQQTVDGIRAIRAEVNGCTEKLNDTTYMVGCSECGHEFRAATPNGFSHCSSHRTDEENFFDDLERALPEDIFAFTFREDERVRCSPQWRTLSPLGRRVAEWAMAGGLDSDEPETEGGDYIDTRYVIEAANFWRRVSDLAVRDIDLGCLAWNAHACAQAIVDRREDESAMAEDARRRFYPHGLYQPSYKTSL